MVPGLRSHDGWRENQQQELEGPGHTCNQEGERDKHQCSTLSFLFRAGPNPGDYTTRIHSRSSFQFKSFWKPSLRPVRRCVSMVILNPVKLTVAIKCHTDEHVFSVSSVETVPTQSVSLSEKSGCPRSWLMSLSQQSPSTKTAQRVFSRWALGHLTVSEGSDG